VDILTKCKNDNDKIDPKSSAFDAIKHYKQRQKKQQERQQITIKYRPKNNKVCGVFGVKLSRRVESASSVFLVAKLS
jgi:hypothetical protein